MDSSQPVLVDPDLPLPEPPAPLPRLTGPGGWTVAEGEATEELFFLAGRRTLLWGTERHGLGELRFHPLRVLLNLDAGLGPARYVRIAPGSLRRELAGPQGPVLERILVFRELPAAAVQWTRPTEAEGPLELDLRFEIGPFLPPEDGGPSLRYRARGGGLRVSLARKDPGAFYFLSHPPEEWLVEEVPVPDGTLLKIRARVRCRRGEAICLGVVGSPRAGEQVEDTLPAFRFLGAQEGQWEGRGRGDAGDPLLVDAPDPRVGEGLDWAKARLDSAPLHDSFQGAGVALGYGAGLGEPKESIWWMGSRKVVPEALWLGLGALAAGRFPLASTILEGTARSRVWEGDPAHALAATPLFLLLGGEFVRWSGSPGVLEVEREAFKEAAEWCGKRLAENLPPGAGALLGAGLSALADGEECLGDREWAARLREEVRVVPDPAPPGLTTPPSLLEALLGRSPLSADGAGRVPELSGGIESALWAWALFRGGHTDAATALWLQQLREGLEPPRGAWKQTGVEGMEDIPNHSPSAGLLLGTFLFGLLGARADAWFGRLRLSPQIPAGWPSLRVRNLRIGDSKVSFFFRQEGARHRFLLEQTAGRVPLNLVFEPLLPTAPTLVLLNGDPVEVGRFQLGSRHGCRLQLPLTREQEVVLTSEG